MSNSFSVLPTYYQNLAMEINCQQPPAFTGANGHSYQDPDPGCTDPQNDIPKLVLITEYMDPTHDAGGSPPSGPGGRLECPPLFQYLDYSGGGDFTFFYNGVVKPLNNTVNGFPADAQAAGLTVPTYAVMGIGGSDFPGDFDGFQTHGVCAGGQRWVDSGKDSVFLLGPGPPATPYQGEFQLPSWAADVLGPANSEELNGALHPNSTADAQAINEGVIISPPTCGQDELCGHDYYALQISNDIIKYNPPATTASATAGGSDYTFGTWANEAVVVTLSANNVIGQSGVGPTLYGVDSPGCLPSASSPDSPPGCSIYDGPVTISSSGLHTLTFFSVNSYGNPEQVHRASVWINVSVPSQPSGPGVNLVSLLPSLTFDAGTDQYVAVANIENTGETTATGVTVTGATLNGTPAVSIAPAGVPSLPFAQFFSAILTFPASAGASGSRGVLIVKEAYRGGTAGGGFRVTLP